MRTVLEALFSVLSHGKSDGIWGGAVDWRDS